ncbi:hypothetical protein JMJ77_0004344 [Colletotrichum scovillei]|uniref:Uncharacterized protein n=1 Tax=Colletotrichum scovillei TaxID=1209932 RepID=A0A9P7QWV9_9PEZI|nr:hypothetical protein JMJ77_0004344 [Colletotrichum scovillei]KAG7049598.1 hypothetical protein JMJ78_0013578 [Colletotrichum scovillei]KAG7064338.1 hypothetical protein JMJ76_0007383 [Colletotrichum scovillei]
MASYFFGIPPPFAPERKHAITSAGVGVCPAHAARARIVLRRLLWPTKGYGHKQTLQDSSRQGTLGFVWTENFHLH